MGIVLIQRGSSGGASLPATVVETDQANTYTTGAQSLAAATSLVLPLAAGAAPTADGDLRFDTTRKSFVAGSSSTTSKGFFPRLLAINIQDTDRLTAATIGTTETAFATLYNVPANFFIANKMLVLSYQGDVTTSAGAPTVIVRVRYGGIAGTVIYSSNVTGFPSSFTDIGWGFDIAMGNSGASSATAPLFAHPLGAVGVAAGGGAFPMDNRTPQPVTVDTTSAKDIVLTMQYGAATAGNTINVQMFRVMEW